MHAGLVLGPPPAGPPTARDPRFGVAPIREILAIAVLVHALFGCCSGAAHCGQTSVESCPPLACSHSHELETVGATRSEYAATRAASPAWRVSCNHEDSRHCHCNHMRCQWVEPECRFSTEDVGGVSGDWAIQRLAVERPSEPRPCSTPWRPLLASIFALPVRAHLAKSVLLI